MKCLLTKNVLTIHVQFINVDYCKVLQSNVQPDELINALVFCKDSLWTLIARHVSALIGKHYSGVAEYVAEHLFRRRPLAGTAGHTAPNYSVRFH